MIFSFGPHRAPRKSIDGKPITKLISVTDPAFIAKQARRRVIIQMIHRAIERNKDKNKLDGGVTSIDHEPQLQGNVDYTPASRGTTPAARSLAPHSKEAVIEDVLTNLLVRQKSKRKKIKLPQALDHHSQFPLLDASVQDRINSCKQMLKILNESAPRDDDAIIRKAKLIWRCLKEERRTTLDDRYNDAKRSLELIHIENERRRRAAERRLQRQIDAALLPRNHDQPTPTMAQDPASRVLPGQRHVKAGHIKSMFEELMLEKVEQRIVVRLANRYGVEPVLVGMEL